ncbi:hemerythrin domain-containing protein [Sandarakinorhabdus sp.]|uniref:hemerythrin domain-containing protein n=1 Tax=Sandarakinorhabdus sp. TaxID=1916663 RepID=UPI00356AE216
MTDHSAYNANGKTNGKTNPGNGKSSALVAGAAGFGLGMLVSAGRKAAAQAPTYAAGDWFEGLKAEHKMARGLLDQLAVTGEDDIKKRAALVFELQHAMGKHQIQEEYVVYCVVAAHGQSDVAEALNADHFDVKQGLYELEMIGKEQRPGFLEKVAAIRTAFEAHVREEEEEVFPALHAKLSEAETKALTGRMNREGFKVA